MYTDFHDVGCNWVFLVVAQPSVNGVSTLIVRHATLEDGGEYTCIATNPANNQQVTAAARVVIKGETVSISTGSLFTFTSSHDQNSFTWASSH